MRRLIAAIFICLICSACSGEEKNVSPAVQFRTDLIEAKGCSFTAEVTADFGQTVQMFSMDCTTDGNDVLYLTVTAPETLSGITATVDQDGGRITYDGMAMDFGLLANGNVIPAAAPAIIAGCWTKEYISSAGQEENLYRVTYQKDFDEKMLIVDTWYEKNVPIYAEICYNDKNIIKLTITNFSFN